MSARLRAAALAAALAVALGLAPAPATASDTTACTVTAAELTWAVDAALRAEAGGWELTGEVGHDGAAFSWTAGTGVADAALPSASVVFDGAVTFPEVGGGTAATIVDPTLVVDGERGRLLLALSADGDAAGDGGADQIPFLDVDLRAATVTKDGDTITLAVVDAPTTLTEGASDLAARAAGTDSEPINATVVADCAAPEADAPVEETGQAAEWLPIAVVAAVAVLVTLLAGGSVARRKRQAAALEPSTAAEPQRPED